MALSSPKALLQKRSYRLRMRLGVKSSLGLWFILSIAAPVSQALFVEDLYVAWVPTVSQSDQQRRQDAARGLEQVLVRVSGRVNVADDPRVKLALQKPEQFYSEFSYSTVASALPKQDPPTQGGIEARLDQTARLTPEAGPGQIMRIRFESSLVGQLLKEAQLPVWGSNRPSVLSWIALRREGTREVVGEALTQPFAKTLAAVAERRGVPLFLPVWDLEDTSTISVAEIWGRFLDRLETASVRYSPDKILVFRAESQFQGQWQGDWSLGEKGQWQGGSVSADSEEALAEALVSAIASNLSEQYAVSSFRSDIELTVEGLTELAAYADVAQYLGGLGQIMSVQPKRFSADMVTFRVKSEGDLQQMIDVIALDRKLNLLRSDPQAGTLWYRWNP
ncbi:MAG: hypothetical protein CBC55_08520 [Gammaproteobacteria bacterium TMED95]|nr:hypothetical protein [Gammaproteobacteria bacterium]OUV20732.1 MAG: hypothetical protein CBC55_08520 [Gammaproteobacteria bacterium TMED95]